MKKLLYIALLTFIASTFGLNSFASGHYPLRYRYYPKKNDTISYKYKTKINFRFANNRTIIGGLGVKFHSIKIGAEFKNKYRMGGLVAWLSDEVIKDSELPDGIEYQQFYLFAWGTYFEYMLFKNYRYELSVPLDLMFTSVTVLSQNEIVHTVDTLSHSIFPTFQAGIYGQYNINYWLGAGVGVGFRLSMSNSLAVNQALTSVYYALGVKVMLGRFVRTAFKHQETLKERIDYFEPRRPHKADKLRGRLKENKNKG